MQAKHINFVIALEVLHAHTKHANIESNSFQFLIHGSL